MTKHSTKKPQTKFLLIRINATNDQNPDGFVPSEDDQTIIFHAQEKLKELINKDQDQELSLKLKAVTFENGMAFDLSTKRMPGVSEKGYLSSQLWRWIDAQTRALQSVRRHLPNIKHSKTSESPNSPDHHIFRALSQSNHQPFCLPSAELTDYPAFDMISMHNSGMKCILEIETIKAPK